MISFNAAIIETLADSAVRQRFGELGQEAAGAQRDHDRVRGAVRAVDGHDTGGRDAAVPAHEHDTCLLELAGALNQLTATARDRFGAAVAGRTVTWSTSPGWMESAPNM